MKSWGCILKGAVIIAILIIAALVGLSVASRISSSQVENPQQQAVAAGTTLENSGDLAMSIIESVTESDVRTLTYLAQLSDQLNRSWLQQALPYTFLTIAAAFGGLVLLGGLLVGISALRRT